MTGENLHVALRGFWREYRRQASGVVGLVLFLAFAAAVAFEPRLITFSQANSRWHDITYWVDNPPSAAPAWTNWFRAKKGAVQRVVRDYDTTTEESDGIRFVHRSFVYAYAYDQPPLDVILRFTATGDVPTALTVKRPDGLLTSAVYRFRVDDQGSAGCIFFGQRQVDDGRYTDHQRNHPEHDPLAGVKDQKKLIQVHEVVLRTGFP